MPSNLIYIIGFIVLTLGLAYGGHLAGLSAPWIAVGVIIMLGIALLKVAKRGSSTRPFDTK